MHNLKSKKKGNYFVITYCKSILGFGFVRNISVISSKLKENFVSSILCIQLHFAMKNVK